MTLMTSPGILLRSHPYSESSRILRFFTPGHGIVSVIGKGVRTRSSRGESPLETFGEGVLTFYYRPDRDLHTLKEFDRQGGSLTLGRDLRRFVGASLLAELLLGHSLEQGDPALYDWVRTVLLHLEAAPASEVPGWIFGGAWRTLAHLGFPPELERCISCEAAIGEGESGRASRFDAAGGGLRCGSCATDDAMARVGPVARAHLMALLDGCPPSPLPGIRGHLRILEAFCLYHVAPRQGIRSFGMLRSLLDEAPGESA